MMKEDVESPFRQARSEWEMARQGLSGDIFRAANPEARTAVGVDLFAFES